MTKNLKLILLAVILLAGIMAMYAGYSFVKNRQTLVLHKGPSIGVVQMEELAKLNPSYGDYEQAKQELAQLQAQYEVEQKALNTKSMMQAEQLKALSQSTDVTDSVNIELKTKVTAKENEMNAQLAEKRKELMNKYMAEAKSTPSESDLEIVNLQLDLFTYLRRIPVNPEAKAKVDAERSAKEARLKELLAAKAPEQGRDFTSIQARINEELAPVVEAGQKELNDYAASLQQELMAKRDEMMQAKAQDIMTNTQLPEAAKWNSEWSQRLHDKEAEVEALHEAILEDIRMRVSVVAKEQSLDLVVIDQISNIKGLDITDAVKATYLAQ